MTSLHQGRYRLGVVASVAILTACGGSQPPIGAGGATQQATPVRGTVAPLRREHKPVVLYSFLGPPDGDEPRSGVDVYQGPNSNAGLIGTTLLGGDANNDGTVYGLTKGKNGAWTESVLYTFGGASFGDGSEPTGIKPGGGRLRSGLHAHSEQHPRLHASTRDRLGAIGFRPLRISLRG
jgi:hypothetical protein